MTDPTVRQALEWLGVTWEDYVKYDKVLEGMHGSPLTSALLDARRVLTGEAEGTPAAILALHGVDPHNVIASAKAFRTQRSGTWDSPKKFEETND